MQTRGGPGAAVRAAGRAARRLSAVAWAYRSVLVANVFLMSPVLLQALSPKGSRLDMIADPVVDWNVACSLALLVTAHLLITRPRTLHLLLFPFYLVALVDLFVLDHYHSRLTAGYIWIIFANTSDWVGYLRQFGPPIAVTFLLFGIGYAWVLRGMGRLRVRAPRRLWLVPFAVACLLYGGTAIRGMQTNDYTLERALADVVEHDFGSPFGVIAQSSIVYSLVAKRDVDVQRRNRFAFGVTRTAPGTQETYIMVVGESARPDRWSIDGYRRETSPRLEKEKNLVVFKDVITSWPLTERAVPMMLSRATVDDFDKATTERSIVSAYREAGFKTYWLSTQAFDSFAGYVYLLAGDANVVRYYSRVYDHALVKGVDSIFSHETGKLFIVLHTNGSHMTYEDRYPPGFAKFPVGGDLSRKQSINNAYDNSILYTDSVLADLIDRLRARSGISALFYCSDHGENLLDDNRDLLGHDYSNRYDLPIPFFFWYSDSYARRYPDKVESALANRGAPLSIDNVFYSLADLGDLRFPAFDPGLSVLGTPLRRTRRRVHVRRGIVDYDRIVRREARAN